MGFTLHYHPLASYAMKVTLGLYEIDFEFEKKTINLMDPAERAELERYLIERAYQHSKALNVASTFELDDVIDPADTRRWILAAIRGWELADRPAPTKRRPFIDTW